MFTKHLQLSVSLPVAFLWLRGYPCINKTVTQNCNLKTSSPVSTERGWQECHRKRNMKMSRMMALEKVRHLGVGVGTAKIRLGGTNW